MPRLGGQGVPATGLNSVLHKAIAFSVPFPIYRMEEILRTARVMPQA
jgi:hypothetical protein